MRAAGGNLNRHVKGGSLRGLGGRVRRRGAAGPRIGDAAPACRRRPGPGTKRPDRPSDCAAGVTITFRVTGTVTVTVGGHRDGHGWSLPGPGPAALSTSPPA